MRRPPSGYSSVSVVPGIEFGEMVSVFFDDAELEERTLTVVQMQHALDRVTAMSRDAFATFLAKRDTDRALPRLVVAVTLGEVFGYPEIVLTERELGTGLIIEGASNRQ